MSHTPTVKAQADGSTEVLNGNLRVSGGIGAHGSDPDPSSALACGDDLGNTRILVGKDGGVTVQGYPAPTDAPSLVVTSHTGGVPAGDWVYALRWYDPITGQTTAAGAQAAVTLSADSQVAVTVPAVFPDGVTLADIIRSFDGGATWKEVDNTVIPGATSNDTSPTVDPTLYAPAVDASQGTSTLGRVTLHSIDGTAADGTGGIFVSAPDGTTAGMNGAGVVLAPHGVSFYDTYPPPATAPILATGAGKSVDDVIALLQLHGICKQS